MHGATGPSPTIVVMMDEMKMKMKMKMKMNSTIPQVHSAPPQPLRYPVLPSFPNHERIMFHNGTRAMGPFLLVVAEQPYWTTHVWLLRLRC